MPRTITGHCEAACLTNLTGVNAMKLPESKIEKVAPTNDVRYYLNCVWLDLDEPGKPLAVATNPE